MNEYIRTTIRADDQSRVARSVMCLSTNREVEGLSSHVGWRFFKVSKSVIYDIIRLQLFTTYKANIICLYPIS